MSVEVFLYSESVRVISRRSLRRELESRGWHLLFMPDWRELKSKSDGVCGDDFIIGCKSAVQLSKIRELIRLKDPLALDSLLAKKEYATCSLGVCYPYEFSRYVRDHEIGELIGAIGEDAVQAMQRAKSEYSVRMHGLQNHLSGHLFNAVWRSLGKLRGGLMEDPQTGKIFLAQRGK